MHELILGAPGVARNAALQECITRVKEHSARLQELADAIPAIARGPFDADTFCSLAPDPDIDTKIQDTEHRLAAAHAADAIRQHSVFQEFGLPPFDLDAIKAVLDRGLADLEAAAAARVQTHITRLGPGGESWVADGMVHIASVSGDTDRPICPFCAQDLGGSELIGHYQAYFGEAYKDLKHAITQTEAAIRKTHDGESLGKFERAVSAARQVHGFWKEFANLPAIDIDTAAIARQWTAARDGVLKQLRAKAAAPLERRTLPSEVRQAVTDYHACRDEVAALARCLGTTNAQLDGVKDRARTADRHSLDTNLAKLMAQKARFDPTVVPHCKAYLAEKDAKAATEDRRDAARTALDVYRTQIFPAYGDAINRYLQRFVASFRLQTVQSTNDRHGSAASYSIAIAQQSVAITADMGPSFRNALSAGDRNTLALAFFFASLDQDPDLANRIVVIDDPMTSLDDHRTLHTQRAITALAAKVRQVVVLSHSKPFLCNLWEQRSGRTAATALRLKRSGSGSEIAVWDVRRDSISEHDKRHELVRGYVHTADPAREREVAEALRFILEAFMRVACPEHFPPGKLLGPFLGLCDQRVGSGRPILSADDIDELKALLDYANRFHHDTNPGGWRTAMINDTELADFASRTLRFASRK